MLAILGTILSSVLGGGATGLLGVLIQRFFDMKNKAQDIEVIKLQHANAVELRRVELEHVAAEFEGRRQIAVAEGDAREAVAEQDRLAREAEAEARSSEASYGHDKSTYYQGPIKSDSWYVTLLNSVINFLMGLVDVLRGSIRPALTVYLTGLLTFTFLWVQKLVDKMGVQQFTPQEAKDLTWQIVGSVIYLTTVSVVWWFGTRPPKHQGDK